MIYIPSSKVWDINTHKLFHKYRMRPKFISDSLYPEKILQYIDISWKKYVFWENSTRKSPGRVVLMRSNNAPCYDVTGKEARNWQLVSNLNIYEMASWMGESCANLFLWSVVSKTIQFWFIFGVLCLGLEMICYYKWNDDIITSLSAKIWKIDMGKCQIFRGLLIHNLP